MIHQLNVINVPSNWVNQDLHNLNSSVWFFKNTPSDLNSNLKNYSSADNNNAVILCFDRVNYYVSDWLNWNYFGKSRSYYSPFQFYISSSLKEKNILIVKGESHFEIPEYSLKILN